VSLFYFKNKEVNSMDMVIFSDCFFTIILLILMFGGGGTFLSTITEGESSILIFYLGGLFLNEKNN